MSAPVLAGWTDGPAGRHPDPHTVRIAAEALAAGRLVALPTETVYGLGADASSGEAVGRIFTAKGRPADHPLIVHLADRALLGKWVAQITDEAALLSDAWWPGPLTLVLPRSERVPDAVTGGRDTVAVRVPDHPVTRAILAAFGGGVAAPSANRFGHVSPTTALHVQHDLGDRIDLIVDGGPCEVGVESTIVDCTTTPIQLLRAGGITPDQVRRTVGADPAAATGPTRASGMLASHYAPQCDLVLVTSPEAVAPAVAELRRIGRRADGWVIDRAVKHAARELYARLRSADDLGLDVLVVDLPPADGLGLALRDRLGKAAHPERHGRGHQRKP
ncbi:MAG: L-threonylcarbamoyladenylate synthase [Ilumatobacteraceae bacterium]